MGIEPDLCDSTGKRPLGSRGWSWLHVPFSLADVALCPFAITNSHGCNQMLVLRVFGPSGPELEVVLGTLTRSALQRFNILSVCSVGGEGHKKFKHAVN